MDNNLATVCIIVIGVLILVLLAAMLLLRVVRASVFGLGMMLMRIITEAKEEPATTTTVHTQAEPSLDDLRAKGKSLDFDAAVAKYREQSHPPAVNPPVSEYPPPAAPPQNPPTNTDQGGGWPHP
jgi:hypothetical protein